MMSVEGRARVDPDAELVEGLRREEPSAIERLVERYADRVYRLAIRITGSKEDAEEAAQDALWTAARKVHTFKGDAAFGSWIYRITANAAYMKVRSRKAKGREIALDEVLPALDQQGLHFTAMNDWSRRVDERALDAELRGVLEAAIAELPPEYRAAFVLHDIEGLPNPDVAETLGVSLPAVKSRIHRSRLFLRKRVTEYLDRAEGAAS